MKRVTAIAVLALAPALAQADTVFLKSGGEIKGDVVERRADSVVIEVGPGRITLPMRYVARIESSTTDVGLYRARAAALAPGDAAGWLELAAWARSRDLATLSRDAYEHALAADPLSAEAHVALGDVRVGDRWLSQADANRERGLVEFEGTWMTPIERQARLEERAMAATERQAMIEADARAREAEARAREAEARARVAEADAAAQIEQPTSSGIPYPYAFGGGPIIAGPYAVNPYGYQMGFGGHGHGGPRGGGRGGHGGPPRTGPPRDTAAPAPPRTAAAALPTQNH
jgi:hypothetical protein